MCWDTGKRAIQRGCSEAEKLKQLAEERWHIDHLTSHGFQWGQEGHRIETIYAPAIARELDQIASRCKPLGEIADVTVGIQVYHNTRVSKEFIKAKGFHGHIRSGPDWHPYIESNDVQRYFHRESSDQWLKFSELLHDKREIEHYRQPRILVQQIFWKRLSAWYEVPTHPSLYLNTIFAVYNARDVPLECIAGILNSKFVSATYERRSNRLFGDKFPKVSKGDLSAVPVPVMNSALAREIGQAAISLQHKWEQFRADLIRASDDLSGIHPNASLADFAKFWELRESDFINGAAEKYGTLQSQQVQVVKGSHEAAVTAVNQHWSGILSAEREMEDLVQKAFGVADEVYASLTRDTPDPSIAWALLAVR